jgi:hypothetical protein
MRRREFIVGVGCAAAWLRVARGQQTKVWRVAPSRVMNPTAKRGGPRHGA